MIYHYDQTGKYTGKSEVTDYTPSGNPRVPRNATLLEPPEPADGHYVAFVDEGWNQIPNQRPSEGAIKNKNQEAAKREQTAQINRVIENDTRKNLGLPPIIKETDEDQVREHIKTLQIDIDNPPVEEAYNPHMPPGVTPPNIKSLAVLITREEGWQGNLGFRVVLQAASDDYTLTNLALAVYTNPDCDGYLYTTGAFQQDAETGEYFAVCPTGQEPGDVDVNMGLLYGAAKLSCFTLPAGVAEKKIYAYEEV